MAAEPQGVRALADNLWLLQAVAAGGGVGPCAGGATPERAPELGTESRAVSREQRESKPQARPARDRGGLCGWKEGQRPSAPYLGRPPRPVERGGGDGSGHRRAARAERVTDRILCAGGEAAAQAVGRGGLSRGVAGTVGRELAADRQAYAGGCRESREGISRAPAPLGGGTDLCVAPELPSA